MWSDVKIYELIRSEFNEDIVLVRHDVDNIYPIYGKGTYKRLLLLLNYALLSIQCLNTGFRHLIPKYEYHIHELIDLEKMYGARATYFFRLITAPKPELVSKLKILGHEIAYHSDRNYSYRVWLSDLRRLESLVNTSIKGFTKHGHSPIRDGGDWYEPKFINYASRAGLKYLAQGEDHPDWEIPRIINNVWVFGHHITLRKTSMDTVKKYLSSRYVPMILLHPEDLDDNDVRTKFEYVITKKRGVSFSLFLSVLERVISDLGLLSSR